MAPQLTFKELSQKNGERLSSPPPGDEVVVAGISGCFPESDNIHELRDNLLTKTDMVVEGRTIWKDDFIGLPKRAGKIKTLNRFDNAFFGIPSIEVECMDPMSRILLEKSFEAIIDAGMNPNELRGKNVGVYISSCLSETEHDCCYERFELNGFAVSGTERVGFANKISRWFGINGRSMMVDTACSSSMVALNIAYEDIRDGISEAAIIGGANLTLSPLITKCFLNLGVIGLEGMCQVFDDKAKGYVRGEAICAVFLQKAKDARRVYATIVHSKKNCDGYKSQGITFPSTEVQSELLLDLYKECQIDPAVVEYVEAHGTGTEVGDPEELLAIDRVYCQGRNTSLPIGSVKSNVGHTEGAAGVTSLAKVILCMELEALLPNLHYETPHRRIDALKNGKLQVVTEKIPFKGSLIGINSFGFGGANVHMLLRHNPKKKVNGGKPTDNIPRLVAVTGRTPESVKSLLNDVMSRPVDAEYIHLMQKAHALNIKGHSYRGYTILTPENRDMVISFWTEQQSPLWLVFSGLGSQWPGMGNALLPIPSFAEAIHKCDSVLKPLGIDIYNIITQQDSRVLNDAISCIVGPIAIQIGLVDILSALMIVPDGIIGHSVGEFVCAYSEGSLSLEQTILSAYYSALAFSAKSSAPKRVMVTVDMVKNQHLQNLEVVGTIGDNRIVIAGNVNVIEKLIQTHKQDVNILQTGGIIYHSKETSDVKKDLLLNLLKNQSCKGFDSQTINIDDDVNQFLRGHVIDGRNLFPATGYLVAVWNTFTQMQKMLGKFCSVHFRNVRFNRATYIPNKGFLILDITIHPVSGDFEVIEGGAAIVTGNITLLKESSRYKMEKKRPTPHTDDKDIIDYSTRDIYKELRLRGYHYSGLFRSLIRVNQNITYGEVRWHDNWVSFLDNLLQTKILSHDSRSLFVPTAIDELQIHVQEHENQLDKIRDEPIFPIYINKKLDLTASGGVQIRGIKANSIARRKPFGEPVLESHQFVPYQVRDNSRYTLRQVVTVCVHVLLDNYGGLKLNVTELPDQDYELLAPMLSAIIGDLPLMQEAQPTNVTRNSIVVKITNTHYDWLPQLQAAIKNNESHKRVLLVSQGERLSGILGLSNCLRREPEGDCVRCVFILDDTAPAFDPKNSLYRTQLDKDLAVNVLKDGQWGSYRHLLLEELASVDAYHAYNNAATYGDLSSLTWLQGPIHPPTFQCPEGTELVHVYYSAVNFRDIMLATGRLAKEVVAENRTDQECVIGIEFAGVTFGGRRVMGITTSGSLSNVVLADKQLLWDIPGHMSLEDAATIPVVYGTVLYAFLVVGRIKKGESVLIHSGSGGVGQAAIHVALHYGLTVFTTVGTEGKRQVIKKEFPQILNQHIGNSRDTSFEQMIMLQTEGRGVDLVLNSLAEEKLQASIRCLAKGGRFLEIGKFDLAANNHIGMKHFLQDISYNGIMLDRLPFAESSGKVQVHNLLREGLLSGSVRPVKCRMIFNRDEVEEAYRYMAAGKHMGKVIIKLRDDEPLRNAKPSLNIIRARPKFYCDPNLCYIIAGGLGGFGLELVDWLVLRRARHLVLVSRKGISSGYQSSRIRTWRSYGTKVLISTQDISTYDGVKQLLKEATQLAPVGGIFNLAVVLHDAILENQTVEKFRESAKGKAVATQHFDLLTREMCPELQQFVVFSSVSCGRGNAGQTNYGMSNSIMERLCESRVRDGLPGLAIQWGAIGEVGLVADMQEDNRELVIGGTLQQTVASCLEALDGFLKQTHPVVASMVVAEKRRTDSSMNLFERVMGILGIRDSNKLSPNATLAELGMDSMTGVEVKQTLERDFEAFLTPVEIREMTMLRLKELSETSDQNSVVGHNTVSEPDNLLNFLALDSYTKEVLKSNQEIYLPFLQLPSLEVSKDPVFIIPGVEGLASSLAPLSAKLNSQAFGLQLYKNISVPEIAEMVELLLPFLKSKLDDGTPLQLIGFSFGGLLALEMMSILEEEGYCGKLVLIDSSPEMFNKISRGIFKDGVDAFQITYILFLLMTWIPVPPSENLTVVEDLKAQSTWDDKLDWFFNKVTPHFEVSPDHFKGINDAIMDRFKSILSYNWNHEKRLISRVMLLQPTMKVVKIVNDYGLSQCCENLEAVHVIEGNHLSILSHPDTSKYINEFFESSSKHQGGLTETSVECSKINQNIE